MSLASTLVNASTHLALLPTVDTPVDLGTESTTIEVTLGGVAAAMGGSVLTGALGITAVRWGIPLVIKFFKSIAGR